MEYFYLNEYAANMQKVVEECVQRALKGQCDGLFKINIARLQKDFKMESIDETLLSNILSERDELILKECYEGEITVEMAPEYMAKEGESNLTVISPQELKVKLAKHYLWLYDEYGGVQADLSNHYIEGFNFDGTDMCSVVLNGAKLVRCNFWNTSMCSAECVGTQFSNCEMLDITAEECNFEGAAFRRSRIERSVFTHSNFQNAKFVQTDISGGSFMNSCMADTEMIESDITSSNMRNVSTSFDEWEHEGDVPGMKM